MINFRLPGAAIGGLLLTLLSSLPATASIVTLAGGTTTVNLNPSTVGALTAAGLSISPLGGASLVGLVATFPITGGSLDTVTNQALIEHDGSGLSFASGPTTLNLENFLIDVNLASSIGVLFGDATLNGALVGNVPIFNIGAGLELTLTSEAAGALTAAFALPDLTGASVGTAATQPGAVPEPSTMLIVAAGLGIVGIPRIRRMLARP